MAASGSICEPRSIFCVWNSNGMCVGFRFSLEREGALDRFNCCIIAARFDAYDDNIIHRLEEAGLLLVKLHIAVAFKYVVVLIIEICRN